MPDAANQRGDVGGQEWSGAMEWKVWSGLSCERGEREKHFLEGEAGKRGAIDFQRHTNPSARLLRVCAQFPQTQRLASTQAALSGEVE